MITIHGTRKEGRALDEQDERVERENRVDFRQTDEDGALVQAVKGGDVGAFEKLVAKYERRIYAVAFRMLADREDARDVSQDAFLRAYKSMSGFHGDSKFSTWIFRIVTNLCIDVLRRRREGRTMSMDAPASDGDGAPTPIALSIVDADADVAASVENAEFRRLVAKAVEMLPDAHRAMVIMRDYQDLSYPEIADALRCPPGTVKSRLNRARAKLRDTLLSMVELEGYFGVKHVK